MGTHTSRIYSFTGSAGVAVVTLDRALMFVDCEWSRWITYSLLGRELISGRAARYYVQAGKQLSDSWDLQKVGEKDVKQWDAWVLGVGLPRLCSAQRPSSHPLLQLPEGSKVGIDATMVDYATAKPLLAKFADKNLSLVFPTENLVDAIWTARPARTACKINLHPFKFSGALSPSLLSLPRLPS